MVTTQNVQGEIHSLDARIDRMHRRDRLGALAVVAALWITVLFVLGSVWALVTVSELRTILVISGGLVLIFNTTSIWHAAPLRRRPELHLRPGPQASR